MMLREGEKAATDSPIKRPPLSIGVDRCRLVEGGVEEGGDDGDCGIDVSFLSYTESEAEEAHRRRQQKVFFCYNICCLN